MSKTWLNHRLRLLVALVPLALPPNVPAQEAAPQPAGDFTLNGSLTGVSQYRLRGVSMSDEKPAIQGSLTLAHKSGFYAGLWASSLSGYGSFGGADTELDAIGGYTATLGGTTLDGGLIWYSFPGTSGHEYTEIFASASHPLGPVDVKLGINYAPKRESIGDADNLYTYADLTLPLGSVPVKFKGHVGYTTGKGSTLAGPQGHYLDYSVGAEYSWRALTVGISYVGTDIGRHDADSYYTVPGGKSGHKLVDGAVLLSLGASF